MPEMIECHRCRASNTRGIRRCRACAVVLDASARERPKGFAALRPDRGFTSPFDAAVEPDGPVPAAAPSSYAGNPEVRALLDHLPCWTSAPVAASQLWEPSLTVDDDATALTDAIVLGIPLSTGVAAPRIVYDETFVEVADMVIDCMPRHPTTPPPVLYETEPYDRRAIFG